MPSDAAGSFNQHEFWLTLNALPQIVWKRVAPATRRVAMVVEAASLLREVPSSIPEVFFAVGPEKPDISLKEAQDDLLQWTIATALRDVVESNGHVLVEAYRACSAAVVSGPEGTCTGAAFSELVRGIQKLRTAPIPSRVKRLKELCGSDFMPESWDAIYSIHQARNCITHSHSIVQPNHCNSNGGLQVRWPRLELRIQSGDGSTRLLGNERRIVGEESLILTRGYGSSFFDVGNRISFTSDEFSEICMGHYLFTVDLVHEVQKFCYSTAGWEKGPDAETGLEGTSTARRG